jgi:hypothetical protein
MDIPFKDSTSPYAWFGVTPTLFDAPSRRDDVPLRWRARSFLATTPWAQDERLVVALAGFGWGYDVDPAGTVAVHGPTPLPGTAWQEQLPYLRARYDRWTFREGPAPGS